MPDPTSPALTESQLAELERLESLPPSPEKNVALNRARAEAFPALLSAARRSLEYEAFFREHRLALVNGLAIRRMQALSKHHEDDLRKPEAALEKLLERLK